MAQLGSDEVLHEPSGDGIDIGGALIQANYARSPQQHARQAQQLLLPCTQQMPIPQAPPT